MKYEGRICRSPMQRGAFMLPVSVGCPYNRCRFCDLFRDLTFRKIGRSAVEAELVRVKQAGGSPKRIFLGDGNAFFLETAELLELLSLIRSYFPGVTEINCDASVTSILAKSDAELRDLADAGMRYLYIGIESGLDDVLLFMQKDHDTAEAKEAVRRLRAAGLLFAAHYMTGIAGRGRGEKDACALAALFNETQPSHIVNFSLFLSPNTPLARDAADGRFVPAGTRENLEEEKRLLELLRPKPGHTIRYEGFHDEIELRVHGELPRDREKLLRILEQKTAELTA